MNSFDLSDTVRNVDKTHLSVALGGGRRQTFIYLGARVLSDLTPLDSTAVFRKPLKRLLDLIE